MRIGIDLGSRKAKFALFRDDKIERLADFDTITFYKRFGSLDGNDLSLDLPGSGLFSSEEFSRAELMVTGYGRNTLTLKGERKMEKEDKKSNYHRVESFYGSFARSFRLPDSVDYDKVSAEYKNGVLTITLPKKPEVKPREIPVAVQ